MPDHNLASARSTLDRLLASLERQDRILRDLHDLNLQAIALLDDLEFPDLD